MEDVTFHGRDDGRSNGRDDGRDRKGKTPVRVYITRTYKSYVRNDGRSNGRDGEQSMHRIPFIYAGFSRPMVGMLGLFENQLYSEYIIYCLISLGQTSFVLVKFQGLSSIGLSFSAWK